MAITTGIVKANSLKDALFELNSNGIVVYKIEQTKNEELSIHERILIYKKRIRILKGGGNEKKKSIKKSNNKIYLLITLYIILATVISIQVYR